ncbi:hypothetical protein BJX63DRAFT_435927 [Aspergillus granulosus]|uniref:Ubiquitin-like protease family profile domain-containing protein n=1 Tax=Aspergillus granulosus TaxID=176169 RepID=A0ABR4GZL4_9EURO
MAHGDTLDQMQAKFLALRSEVLLFLQELQNIGDILSSYRPLPGNSALESTGPPNRSSTDSPAISEPGNPPAPDTVAKFSMDPALSLSPSPDTLTIPENRNPSSSNIDPAILSTLAYPTIQQDKDAEMPDPSDNDEGSDDLKLEHSEARLDEKENALDFEVKKDENGAFLCFKYKGFPITLQHIETVRIQAWLEDPHIQFFCHYTEAGLLTSKVPWKLYFFDPVSVEMIINGHLSQIYGAEEGQVRRLLTYDHLVIPVASCDHWFMVILAHFKELCHGDNTNQNAGVYILDSKEIDWHEQYPPLMEFVSNAARVSGIQQQAQHQINFYQAAGVLPCQSRELCGFYLMAYIETFAKNPDALLERIRTGKLIIGNLSKWGSLDNDLPLRFLALLEKFRDGQPSASNLNVLTDIWPDSCENDTDKTAERRTKRPRRRLRGLDRRLLKGRYRSVRDRSQDPPNTIDLTLNNDDHDIDGSITPCYQLSTRDLETCAKPGAWLNDEVINTYLRMLADYANSSGRVTCHALNSFFFPTYVQEGHNTVCRKGSHGKQISLAVDIIFMPIHYSEHWTLIVLHPYSQTIQGYDSLHGASLWDHLDRVKTWLDAEYKSGSGIEWTIGDHVSPRQENDDDCGVFVLTTARSVVMGGPLDYKSDIIPAMRERIVAELKQPTLLTTSGEHGEERPRKEPEGS